MTTSNPEKKMDDIMPGEVVLERALPIKPEANEAINTRLVTNFTAYGMASKRISDGEDEITLMVLFNHVDGTQSQVLLDTECMEKLAVAILRTFETAPPKS